jgi:hypothetical protein
MNFVIKFVNSISELVPSICSVILANFRVEFTITDRGRGVGCTRYPVSGGG